MDEDLEGGARLRHQADARRIDLDGEIGLRPAGVVRLIGVGPKTRRHDLAVGADDDVLVADGNALEQGVDPRRGGVDGARTLVREVGVEAGFEVVGERAGDRGMMREGVLDIGLAERDFDLPHVTAIGAQDLHLARAQPGEQHQPIEAVVLDLARPDPREGVVETLAGLLDVDVGAARDGHAEVVQPEVAAVDVADTVGLLVEDGEAHVGEDRQRPGERDFPVGADELETQQVRARRDRAVEAQAQGAFAPGEAGDVVEIGHGEARRRALLVARGNATAIELKAAMALGLTFGLDERAQQPVGPRPRQLA